MKEGAWINGKTGKFAWITEHASWVKDPENARSIGVPESVIEKIQSLRSDFNGKGREEILATVMQAGFIRMRGHGSFWTFEFTMPSEEALWACMSFLQDFAGPFTQCRFNNLRTGETIDTPFQEFEKTMQQDPTQILRIAKVVTYPRMASFLEHVGDEVKVASGYPRLMQIMKGLIPTVHTFGIMSVDNPQNQALSEEENQKRRNQFKADLKRGYYGYVQHNGMYDRPEKAFFIMNVRLSELTQWCGETQFDQESYIYGQVNHDEHEVVMTLYYGATPGPQRKVVLRVENGVENYYSEYKGRKFVIPFFDETEAPESEESNLPTGVPFDKNDVDTPKNASQLNLILANAEGLRKDALGLTVGMGNWNKRGMLLQAVRQLEPKPRPKVGMDSKYELALILKYVRMNLSSFRSMLTRPDAAKAIHDKLKKECPRGELADLMAPIIMERAQGVIQETKLKQALEGMFNSQPGMNEELDYKRTLEDEKGGATNVMKASLKTAVLIPHTLSSFKDDQTNQKAAELFSDYSARFDTGKAIALTRRDLMRSDYDMATAAPRPPRVPSTIPPSAPPKPKKPEPGAQLFSDEELRFPTGMIQQAAPSPLRVKVTSPQVDPKFFRFWMEQLYNSGAYRPLTQGAVQQGIRASDVLELPFYNVKIKDVAQIGQNLPDYDFLIQRVGNTGKVLTRTAHKVAALFHDRGWILPTGEFLPVKGAVNLDIREFNQDEEHHDMIAERYFEGGTEEAYDNEWIRIGVYGTEGYADLGGCNDKQFNTMWSHFNETKPKFIIFGYLVEGRLDLEDFLKCKNLAGIERAVRRTYRTASGQPTMGFNVNDSAAPFTDWILRGEKEIETRNSDSLRSHIGERVGIIRTGVGPATLVGYCTLGEPIIYRDNRDFRQDQSQHMVPEGPMWDVFPGMIKYGYPILDVEPCQPKAITSQGRVWRRLARIEN